MKPKRVLSLLFRLGVGVAAIGLLVYFGRIDLGALAGTLGRPDLLALACFLMLALVPLAAFRWWLLLGALGFRMPFGWTVRTTLITVFFSVFLPGAYGGDVVRIALAYRKAGSGLSRVTFSVLVDRLSGLVASAAIGLCMLPSLRAGLREMDYFVPLALLIGVIAGACIFGLVFGARTAALLKRLPAFFKSIHHIFNEAVGALRTYANQWPLMIGLFLLSVLAFVMLLGSIAALGLAMGFNALSLPAYFTAGIWAMIANSIPLTPGGLGVGEAAFAQLAHMLEQTPTSTSYATAFLAMRVLNALIGILGLLPYILHRQEISQAVERAAAGPETAD
jgi:uncharacterized protein (TIRG00374 family)